jgi:MFS transporter, ACS family, hexuronate transporter
MTPTRQNRLAWMVVLLLFLGSVWNYLDRAVLGVVMPQVRRDLALTNTDYGVAVNAFLLLYMIFYILGGRLADSLGSRRTFTLTVLCWSVAHVFHALASGLRSLCLFRALLGIGEGGYYPTAMRGAAEWFAPKDRAKAVGILLCGLTVGTMVAPPLVASLAARCGWRATFVVTGVLSLLLIPPWWLLQRRIHRLYGTPDPAPAARVEANGNSSDEFTPSLREVLKRRKYWCVLAARALTDGAWYFYLFWIPGYFQEARHFDLGMIGRWLWIPFFAANVGSLAGAWASSALLARGFALDRSRKGVLIPAAVLGGLGALTHVALNPFAGLGLVSVALFGQFAWASNIHTVITEITPRRHMAVLYGITGSAGTLVGALTQPLIGRVVDTGGYAPVFAGAGAAYALALALLLAAGRIEPIRSTEPRRTATDEIIRF